MSNKIWMALGCAAAAAMTLAAPAAHARTDASIYLNIGGGAPAYYGYAQPGYVYSQPAYVYSQPTYVYPQPYYGGHRHYRRDRDGDGVPNRFDRRPDNPYRY